MSNGDQQQNDLGERKLGLLLNLSQEVLSFINGTLPPLSQRIESPDHSLTIRDFAQIGLALKALASFECLAMDADRKRGESAHHLKTLVESFIYYHWVGMDVGTENAKLVRAACYRERAIYYSNSGVPSDLPYAAEWKILLAQEVVGLEDKWKAFKKKKIQGLAKECGLAQHYQRIYKLACSAAHITDLSNYMPPFPEGDHLSLAPAPVSMLHAYVSLHQGIHIVLDVLYDASNFLGLNLDAILQGLRERKDTIVSLAE